MKIGEQLRTIRKGAGLTQEYLAQVLNITSQTLSNWEQDRKCFRGVLCYDVITVRQGEYMQTFA